MNTKLLSFFTIAAFVVGSVVVLPAVSAQTGQTCGTVSTPSMNIEQTDTPDGPVRPVTEQAEVKFRVTYAGDAQSRSVVPIVLTIDASASDPSWTTLSWSPQNWDITSGDQGQLEASFEVTVTGTFDRTAPAFRTTTFKIDVTGTEGTCVRAPPAKSQSALVTVGFYEQIQAQFTQQIFKTGQNSQVSIPLTIDNFGNGGALMRFAINENTDPDLNVPIPSPMIVPSTFQGGETNKAELTVDVQTPFKNGYENRKDPVIIDIAGTSADDTNIDLQPLQVAAVIQTQGVYVPGFEAATLLTGLIGLAFLGRRRL